MGVIFHELKGLRVSKQDTQEDLATFLGLSKTSYTKRENGGVDFTWSELCMLKRRYDLNEEKFCHIFFGHEVELKETYVAESR